MKVALKFFSRGDFHKFEPKKLEKEWKRSKDLLRVWALTPLVRFSLAKHSRKSHGHQHWVRTQRSSRQNVSCFLLVKFVAFVDINIVLPFSETNIWMYFLSYVKTAFCPKKTRPWNIADRWPPFWWKSMRSAADLFFRDLLVGFGLQLGSGFRYRAKNQRKISWKNLVVGFC